MNKNEKFQSLLDASRDICNYIPISNVEISKTEAGVYSADLRGTSPAYGAIALTFDFDGFRDTFVDEFEMLADNFDRSDYVSEVLQTGTTRSIADLMEDARDIKFGLENQAEALRLLIENPELARERKFLRDALVRDAQEKQEHFKRAVRALLLSEDDVYAMSQPHACEIAEMILKQLEAHFLKQIGIVGNPHIIQENSRGRSVSGKNEEDAHDAIAWRIHNQHAMLVAEAILTAYESVRHESVFWYELPGSPLLVNHVNLALRLALETWEHEGWL